MPLEGRGLLMTDANFPQPLNAALIPRFAGLSTFMRLPVFSSAAELDVALIGVPFDGGTTNRPGARHGPREIRNQSSLMRRTHHVTSVSPYDRIRVGDLGDAPVNPIDLLDSLSRIEGFFKEIATQDAIPISAGGDHLMTLPILRGLVKNTPVGLIQFDAHSDTNDTYFGNNPYTHGSPFRRAIEEGLLDARRIVQIGIRGSIYHPTDLDYARSQGIRIFFIEEVEARGVDAVMAEARAILGAAPTYVTFDIDCLDPSFAVGTGTPEIGGLTTREAQRMLRLLQPLHIIGADVVEVSPPFDPSGLTALTAATMMFELLCAIAGGPAFRGRA
jgi:guanidinopropionase